MKTQIFLLVTACVLAVAFWPQPASAQFESARDTFKVLDVECLPGDTCAVQLFVVNDSTNLAAISAYFRIDNNLLEWVGVWDSVPNPPVFYPNYDTLPRAQIPGLFQPYAPLVMVTNTTLSDIEFGVLVGAGSDGTLPVGRGSIIQFYVKVKDDVPLNTETMISPFNPVDLPPHDDPRQSQYADQTGLLTVYPTLVPGRLTVKEPGPEPENEIPVISPITPSSWNVSPNDPINFTVSASDPDFPAQVITLSSSGLPTGATFGSGGSVTGTGNASGSFSWIPTTAQLGTYTIIFQCQDEEGAYAVPAPVTITVSSGVVIDTDFLFTNSSHEYGFPSGGIPGLDQVPIPINLLEFQDVYGVQFDFIFPPSLFSVDSLIATERLLNFTVYDDIGTNPGRIRVVAFGLDNEKIESGISSSIFNLWVTVNPAALTGEYEIDFENVWESISPNPSYPSVELNFDTTGVFVVDQMGDVNGDGYVNVADVVVIVGYIIGDHSLDHRQFHAGDMVSPVDAVDVNDLVAIVNAIFAGPVFSPGFWGGPAASLDLETGDADGQVYSNVSVVADLPTDISGVQLEIAYNADKVSFLKPQLAELAEQLNFRYRDDGNGRLRLLLYPGTEAYINAGNGVLMDLPVATSGAVSLADGDIKISNAILSDPQATEIPVDGYNRLTLPEDFTLQQNYPNPFNPQTTIEFSVGAGAAGRQVSLSVYNVLGERVKTLINEPLGVGRYSVDWLGKNENGQQVASGVYFYRLEVGELSATKKMLLMK